MEVIGLERSKGEGEFRKLLLNGHFESSLPFFVVGSERCPKVHQKFFIFLETLARLYHHTLGAFVGVKVSAASSPLPIKPGFLKESIIVLSKPKSGTNTWLKAETSASVAINDIPQKMPENSKINPRAVSVRPRLKSTKVAVPKKRKATPGSHDIDNFLPNKRARVVSSEYANAVPAFPVSSCHSVTTAPLVTPHTFPFDDALSNIPVIVNAEEVHNQDEICILNAFKKIAWRNFQDWCH